MASRLGKTTIELHNISKSFDDKTIIKDFSYNFLKNDRIGIIGPNGAGKSTLLKLIMGQHTPDSGAIEIGPTVKIGYFAQEIKLGEDMNPNQRVIDYIKDVAEYVETEDGKITAARLLERFLFKGEDQYGLIGKLSGGERRRLYLCKVLMAAPNVLILDEPTNDLDITTLTVLEDYLDHFNGIVIAVSHDRYFLDRAVRRIFAFKPDGTLRQSEGGYTDYEIRKAFEEGELGVGTGSKNAESKTNKLAESSSDSWKQKPREKKLKFSYNEQREYETIEDDIAKLEERLEQIEDEITKNSRDFVKLQQLSTEKDELNEKLLEKMERWEYLEELAAAIKAQKGN